MSKPIPIIVDKIYYGSVFTSPGGLREYFTQRKGQTVFQNVPCKLHGRCPGLTISKEVVERIEPLGVLFIKVLVKEDSKKSEYITQIGTLKEAALTQDSKQKPQYSLPLHAWVKV